VLIPSDNEERFRRERPASGHWKLRSALHAIFLILLLPIYLIADLLQIVYWFILRIAREFTGKNIAKKPRESK